MGGKFGILAIPNGYISGNQLSELVNKLERTSIEDSEELLATNIRSVAAKNPKRVGVHCMSVLLPPGGKNPIRIRFIPKVVHAALFSTLKTKRSLPVAYSPWIIGPDGFLAPSIIIGESQLHMRQLEIILEAPNPENGTIGYMGAQQRPPAPKARN